MQTRPATHDVRIPPPPTGEPDFAEELLKNAGPMVQEALEAGLAFGTDYWLSHCEGFRVDSPGGSLGFVEEIIFAGVGDEPEALVVVGGLSGTRRWLVPVGEVAVVQPRRELVSLEVSPANVRHLAERQSEVASFAQYAL